MMRIAVNFKKYGVLLFKKVGRGIVGAVMWPIATCLSTKRMFRLQLANDCQDLSSGRIGRENRLRERYDMTFSFIKTQEAFWKFNMFILPFVALVIITDPFNPSTFKMIGLYIKGHALAGAMFCSVFDEVYQGAPDLSQTHDGEIFQTSCRIVFAPIKKCFTGVMMFLNRSEIQRVERISERAISPTSNNASCDNQYQANLQDVQSAFIQMNASGAGARVLEPTSRALCYSDLRSSAAHNDTDPLLADRVPVARVTSKIQ